MDNNSMQDQDRITDMLNHQKFTTSNYNSFVNECASDDVRNKMMGILTDEHQIQAEIFNSMQQRGWYNPAKATQQEVNQLKEQCKNC